MFFFPPPKRKSEKLKRKNAVPSFGFLSSKNLISFLGLRSLQAQSPQGRSVLRTSLRRQACVPCLASGRGVLSCSYVAARVSALGSEPSPASSKILSRSLPTRPPAPHFPSLLHKAGLSPSPSARSSPPIPQQKARTLL